MKIEIIKEKEASLARILSDKIEISTVQDALDLMANCDYMGSNRIIIDKKNILESFFNLRTGLAGEILQKFSTYNKQLAIVGDFSTYTSKSLRDFIYESNKIGRILFVPTLEEAIRKLSK